MVDPQECAKHNQGNNNSTSCLRKWASPLKKSHNISQTTPHFQLHFRTTKEELKRQKWSPNFGNLGYPYANLRRETRYLKWLHIKRQTWREVRANLLLFGNLLSELAGLFPQSVHGSFFQLSVLSSQNIKDRQQTKYEIRSNECYLRTPAQLNVVNLNYVTLFPSFFFCKSQNRMCNM